jgi:hypothetical protein
MNILFLKKLKILFNKLNLICNSVGLSEDCSYNPTESAYYIKNSNSIKDSINILDAKIKELESKIN